jgi:hypothetical protein
VGRERSPPQIKGTCDPRSLPLLRDAPTPPDFLRVGEALAYVFAALVPLFGLLSQESCTC